MTPPLHRNLLFSPPSFLSLSSQPSPLLPPAFLLHISYSVYYSLLACGGMSHPVLHICWWIDSNASSGIRPVLSSC